MNKEEIKSISPRAREGKSYFQGKVSSKWIKKLIVKNYLTKLKMN